LLTGAQYRRSRRIDPGRYLAAGRTVGTRKLKPVLIKEVNMYRSIRNFVFVILLLPVCWAGPAMAGSGHAVITVADVGLATPESVEYYAAEDVYLVGNINGSPFEADGNGFISKIRPDGSVADLKWIDGTKTGVTLHSPKGLAIHRGKLFVADRNQVHVFDLPSGRQLRSITIAGSTFLNGITPGPGDYVYVTDSGYLEGFAPSGTDAVYKVRANGKYRTVIRDKGLGNPNGILANGSNLLLVTFGSGEVLEVNSAGKITRYPGVPNGGLDGLVQLRDGRYAFSSWGGSAIYAMDRRHKFSEVANTLDAPADMGLDTRRNVLLIPLFKQNKVVLLPLTK
jgi:hypothetical protein